MRRSISILALMIFLAGLMAFYASGKDDSGSREAGNTDLTIRQLKARVANLENQLEALQKQVKALEQKSSRVLAIPDTKMAPGRQMPPGARQHEIGGIKYWTIPLGPGQ